MSALSFITGLVLIIIVLWDAFETVVFPRRVTRRFRLVRFFYRLTWRSWSGAVLSLVPQKRQENLLSFYGPLSLILLLAFWAFVLIAGFGLLYWAQPGAIKTPTGVVSFDACLYFSGTTFFTLGLGDAAPLSALARFLSVFEAGMGFGFLAIVISYLPAVNQSFSRREVNISLLDARAGSPPSAAEMLRRHAQDNAMEALTGLLHEWERWSADLLESHLSFPMLVYFRSQHDNQSWLAALTSILDTCAFVSVHLAVESARQAQLTFAMARHALVDLALVLHAPPREPETDRLPATDLRLLRTLLESEGMRLHAQADADQRLAELRRMYEPYVFSLSRRLFMQLPPWIPEADRLDNWQVSEWGRSRGFARAGTRDRAENGHF